jgi:rubrerythrin
VKKKVELEKAKEEKYKHISYLSKSIQRQTDTNKIINYRSYKKLVRYQEDAVTNLKKFKTTLRKDNE